jgi:hypothetical protein
MMRDLYTIGFAVVVAGSLWLFALFVLRSFRAYAEAMRLRSFRSRPNVRVEIVGDVEQLKEAFRRAEEASRR